ncbi:erythromycin esterase family protein [Kitasatospora sp. CM 4170]|uniref:Erythromycin esterase family protein n=1 Tax=Kitasatospora aburaviensis TaxID=67265 RepID=A0ABW1EVS8_9ACTN|nr:erythromycin esterase family protein [Kitasatospora sp. CM 4170]WNM44030.1 erythromycin esterase family protein [Kitasatospora sp. CM 4170]
MAGSNRIGRRGLLTAAVAAAAVVVPGVAVAAPTGPGPTTAAADPAAAQRRAVVRALESVAQPLRTTEPGGRTADLRALGSMIGDAEVVGLGEATHGSHEFFAMKHRLFRYLVEEKGFTAFALETSWSSGLQIDEYVQGGPGDARQLVKDALGGSPWDREEFVDLIAWMRTHNRSHPQNPVHFVGDDLGLPRLGDRIFERVTSHVRAARPDVLPQLDGLYAGLRPFDDVFAYLRKPLAERRDDAAKAQQALDLVTASGAGASGDEAHAWAVQHARNIAETFAFATLDVTDPASVSAAEQLRDRAMADNTAWWQRRTGGKVLLSAHNGHTGYLATDTFLYPKPQGSRLRDTYGRAYVAIGFTFDSGSFLTNDAVLTDGWKSVTVPAATPDMNEYTLDQVRHRDYYVDLRTVPRAARDWLDVSRPTYDAGSVYRSDPMPRLAIGRAYDVLIHLNQVTRARMS